MPTILLITFFLQAAPQDMEVAAPEGLVWVEGGEYTMGGVGPEARQDEFPRHRVQTDLAHYP